MNITGMTKEMNCFGRTLRFCNQKSRDWTHLYEYEGNGSDLHDAGCGVFALVHAIEWMHGIRLDPNEVAEVSVAVGGRGDDGTDRPAMLQGMMDCGFAKKNGFRYDGDGLLNDHELLWRHMAAGNAALCNLRVGHIVALLDARKVNGQRQLLAIARAAIAATDANLHSIAAPLTGTLIDMGRDDVLVDVYHSLKA